MRLDSLTVACLALAAHPGAYANGPPITCTTDCTIVVTVDETDTTTAGHCKPVVPSHITINRTDPSASLVITWTLEKSASSDGFRFSKGLDHEKRGILLTEPPPPPPSHYTHKGPTGVVGALFKSYQWTVSPPTSASDKDERAYEVNVRRRPPGDLCAAADPVIVNMN